VIYLTETRTACTDKTELIDEILHPQKVHWFPDTYARKDTGMIYAPHKLAEKVLDAEVLARLRENPAKTAFILASGNSHFAGIEPREMKKSRLTYTFKFLPLALTQVYAGRTAAACGAKDMVITDASACASSLKVMMDVINLVNVYSFERVIVLAVEDAVTNSVLGFFGDAGACLTEKEQESGVIPSAFDGKNYGFHVGQGAAFAVFETEKSMMFKPKAQLLGAYTAAEDFTNAIGQREDGQGFAKAMQGAMDVAKVKPEDIKIVKTHGTGTKSNNQAEKTALLSTLKDFVATSYKPTIGHTMGASGLLETILLLDNIQNGFVPPIQNRTEKDQVFLSESVPAEKGGLVMSLAAGMGNIYSAAIFKDAQC